MRGSTVLDLGPSSRGMRGNLIVETIFWKPPSPQPINIAKTNIYTDIY